MFSKKLFDPAIRIIKCAEKKCNAVKRRISKTVCLVTLCHEAFSDIERRTAYIFCVKVYGEKEVSKGGL